MPRIIPVAKKPYTGLPYASSKTEPTAAMAVMQLPTKNKPLFGVIVYTKIDLKQLIGLLDTRTYV